MSADSSPVPPTDPDDPHWLPPKPKRDRSLVVAGSVIGLALVAGLIFTLLNSAGVFGSEDGAVVTIGTTEGSEDYWPVLQRLAAEEGIRIELVNFSDYSQPNPALAQGQTDLNLFQHLVFLADYNVSSGEDLTPIGSTVVVPLGIYSDRHDSLEAVPAGGVVAIPNDPTNQSRALLVLQQAGLVTLRGGGSIISTPADVLGTSKVRVEPVSAQQTVASLPSVDAAVINNGFAQDADIDPDTAIFSDDPNSPAAEPYINAFVSRAADRDNETYQRIVEIYHRPEVTEVVRASSRDTAVIVDQSGQRLQEITVELEETLR